MVDWKMQPRWTRPRLRVRALVRLPLWAIATPPCAISAKMGWTSRSWVLVPLVEYRLWPIAALPGSMPMTLSEPNASPTLPGARWAKNCVPSKLTMPAASCPRCWRACRPSAVIAAAFSVPNTPKMPHSSRKPSNGIGAPLSASRVMARRLPRCCRIRSGSAGRIPGGPDRGSRLPQAARSWPPWASSRRRRSSAASAASPSEQLWSTIRAGPGTSTASMCAPYSTTGRVRAPRTNCGQSVNTRPDAKSPMYRAETITRPRTAPKMKPSARSSGASTLAAITPTSGTMANVSTTIDATKTQSAPMPRAITESPTSGITRSPAQSSIQNVTRPDTTQAASDSALCTNPRVYANAPDNSTVPTTARSAIVTTAGLRSPDRRRGRARTARRAPSRSGQALPPGLPRRCVRRAAWRRDSRSGGHWRDRG